MVKARSIGTGIGAFFNNPGVLILGGLAIALLFFQKDIRGAFGSLGESISGGFGAIGDINLGDINIDLPSFDFGGLFGGGSGPFPDAILTEEGDVAVIPLGEPGAAINPADQPTNPTPVDIAISEGLPLPPLTEEEILLDPNQDPTKFLPPIPEEGDPLFIGPSQPFMLPTPIAPTPEPLPDPISPITGTGGPSFEGGTIFETPITTLTGVLDVFPDISASMAADFLAENFGITPSEAIGIGPDIINISGDPMQEITILPASSPEFTGLTPEEIFAQLVGGNISNF